MTTALDGDSAAVPASRRAALMVAATRASIAVALTLIVAKSAAWFVTDSVSVLSSLFDSLLDTLASLLNLFAIRHALTPADAEHRFGHGKAEPLAGLGQAAFIAGSALFLSLEAVRRFGSPQQVVHGEIGIAVMLLAIVMSLALVVFQRRVVRVTGSVAIAADALHYRSDLLLNGSVILSLGLQMTWGLNFLDPLFALGIAAYVLSSAWRIVGISLDRLMDRELPDADRARIREVVLRNSAVRAVHDLRTRSAGADIFIQLILEIDGGLTLTRSHDVADEVERELHAAFPNAQIFVHQEPVGLNRPRRSFRTS